MRSDFSLKNTTAFSFQFNFETIVTVDLGADKFLMSSGGWTLQGFVAIWIPVGLSNDIGLSP